LAKAALAQATWPLVIKADGLAQGKGVVIAESLAEAEAALDFCFSLGQTQVLLEQFLIGQELSVLALTDGKVVKALLPAQDHKRIGEEDTGANTGGMGAFSPVPWVTAELIDKIQNRILAPTLQALCARGIEYRGVLYAGLMIDQAGEPWVIEFNCRFGDPETQVVLPLLATDFAQLSEAVLQGSLADLTLEWHPGYAACVIVAAGGYPGPYEKGDVITGIPEDGLVFQAGTQRQGAELRTSGGRVLGVTGRGATLAAALENSYATLRKIQFRAMYYRRDIGRKALKM
jgi:phosphoribosylamine--glycine ligase